MNTEQLSGLQSIPAMTNIPDPVCIHGNSLANIWATACWLVMSDGMLVPADMPKDDGILVMTYDIPGLQLDMRIGAIHDALNGKVHPKCTITDPKAIDTYCDQYRLDTEAGWKSATENTYSYADRFENHPRTLRGAIQNGSFTAFDNHPYRKRLAKYETCILPPINQTEHIGMNHTPFCRRQVMKTWVPDLDLFDAESPCLQTAWVRQIDMNGNTIVNLHYRSLDVYGASIYDLIGQIRYIHEKIIVPNDLNLIQVLVMTNSGHIYERDWDAANELSPVLEPLPNGCGVRRTW